MNKKCVFSIVGIFTFLVTHSHSSFAVTPLFRNIFAKAPSSQFSLLRSLPVLPSSLRLNPYYRLHSTLSAPSSPDNIRSSFPSVKGLIMQEILDREYSGSDDNAVGPNLVECRLRELSGKGNAIEVISSKSLEDIFELVKIALYKFNPESDSVEKLPNHLPNVVESQLADTNQFRRYSGTAPITDGSVYEGTVKRGGILSNVWVDIGSKEFQSSIKELERLQSHTPPLPLKEIVSRFTEYFRNNVMHDSRPSCAKWHLTQDITRKRSGAPLSDFLFLGYGDCRPHALAMTALLNHIGVEAEFVNVKLAILKKNRQEEWDQAEGNQTGPYDHALALYTGEDGKKYIADSYHNKLNNILFDDFREGIVVEHGEIKIKLESIYSYPSIYVPKHNY